MAFSTNDGLPVPKNAHTARNDFRLMQWCKLSNADSEMI